MRATGINKGLAFKKDGKLYLTLDKDHITPGKGNALVQVKAREILTGKVVRVRFRSNEDVETIHFEFQRYQYSYKDQDDLYAMDLTTYETVSLPMSLFEKYGDFLQESIEFGVAFYEDQPIAIDFPKFLELEVTYTEPGLKGDSVTNHVKPVTCETGCEIKAPLFIEIGDKIKVDIESRSYVERVK